MPINASIERKKRGEKPSLEYSFFLFEVILKYMYVCCKSNINNFLVKPHAILTNSTMTI